jgi:hypothetical protein
LLNVSKTPIFVIEMKKGLTYHKVIVAFLLVLVGHISFGTGITEKSNRSTFTLKNLNKNKTLTLSPNITGNFQFKGSQFLSVQKGSNNTLQVNTVIRYQNGNTTYIFPYKYKVKAPLFKAPAAPANR